MPNGNSAWGEDTEQAASDWVSNGAWTHGEISRRIGPTRMYCLYWNKAPVLR